MTMNIVKWRPDCGRIGLQIIPTDTISIISHDALLNVYETSICSIATNLDN